VSAEVIECLDTVIVARLAGVNRSTLDYWVRTGLVTPSLRDLPGRRRTRLWRVEDAVVVRAVASLRAAGCSLQRIRAAVQSIEGSADALGSDATLYWDGFDVLKIDHEGAVESLLRYPGQRVFRPVALPLGLWDRETKSRASFIDSGDLKTGRPFETREEAERVRDLRAARA
jgi:DNA-binding transcriptional MerR regulator